MKIRMTFLFFSFSAEMIDGLGGCGSQRFTLLRVLSARGRLEEMRVELVILLQLLGDWRLLQLRVLPLFCGLWGRMPQHRERPTSVLH
jgi:hypothetical protein